MTRRERRLRELASEAGLVVVAVEPRRHLRVTVRGPGGAERYVFVAATPSDVRGERNEAARFRRVARQLGEGGAA